MSIDYGDKRVGVALSDPMHTISYPLCVINQTNQDNLINEISCKVVEIKRKSGNIKLWIDPVDFIIHKKQFYNKDSEIEKEVSYENLTMHNDLKFYNHEIIHNHKKKSIVEIFLTAFEQKTFDSIDLFNIPLEK